MLRNSDLFHEQVGHFVTYLFLIDLYVLVCSLLFFFHFFRSSHPLLREVRTSGSSFIKIEMSMLICSEPGSVKGCLLLPTCSHLLVQVVRSLIDRGLASGCIRVHELLHVVLIGPNPLWHLSLCLHLALMLAEAFALGLNELSPA